MAYMVVIFAIIFSQLSCWYGYPELTRPSSGRCLLWAFWFLHSNHHYYRLLHSRTFVVVCEYLPGQQNRCWKRNRRIIWLSSRRHTRITKKTSHWARWKNCKCISSIKSRVLLSFSSKSILSVWSLLLLCLWSFGLSQLREPILPLLLLLERSYPLLVEPSVWSSLQELTIKPPIVLKEGLLLPSGLHTDPDAPWDSLLSLWVY